MEVESATVDHHHDDLNNIAAATLAVQKSQHLILPDPPRAPVLQHMAAEARLYWDRSHYSSPAAQLEALTGSSTLYVGNMAFTTRTARVYHHFAQLGVVKRVVMGLDRLRKTPCGFCFVEYMHRYDALTAVSVLSGTKLDGRVIRVELDAGFQPGRQYGRGVSGGQVRDDVAKRNNAQNTNNKRGRTDNTDYSATNKRASDAPPLPVSLDGALPSARSQAKEEFSGAAPDSGYNNEEDDKMEEDDAPSSKRQKRE